MTSKRVEEEWLDSRQLTLFLRIAEARSFSHASTLLGVSQSVLSRHIRRLEAAAGVEVFYRNGRGVALTEAGRRLQSRANSILMELAAARDELTNLKNQPAGTVVVGVQPNLSRWLTVPIAVRAVRELPDAQLSIMEGASAQILEWLDAGRLNVALYYSQHGSRSVNAEAVLQQDMLLVGPPEAGMTLERSVPASRLAEIPLILPMRPHGLRIALDDLAVRKRLSLSVRVEANSASTAHRVGTCERGVRRSLFALCPRCLSSTRGLR